MVEFRQKEETRWEAAIDVHGLRFAIDKVDRKRDPFLLDIERYHSTAFSGKYRSYDAAVKAANREYKKILKKKA